MASLSLLPDLAGTTATGGRDIAAAVRCADGPTIEIRSRGNGEGLVTGEAANLRVRTSPNGAAVRADDGLPVTVPDGLYDRGSVAPQP